MLGSWQGVNRRKKGENPLFKVFIRVAAPHMLTFMTRSNAALSTTAGFVFGIANIVVTPPAKAADEQLVQSSLWVAPGSLT